MFTARLVSIDPPTYACMIPLLTTVTTTSQPCLIINNRAAYKREMAKWQAELARKRLADLG